jgi:hypothetical protein
MPEIVVQKYRRKRPITMRVAALIISLANLRRYAVRKDWRPNIRRAIAVTNIRPGANI